MVKKSERLGQGGHTFFTLSMMILVIALMALISHPGVNRVKSEFHRRICVENLAAIQAAKEHYALDHELNPGAVITLEALIRDGRELKRMPICPDGGKYSVNPVGIFPSCSLDFGHSMSVIKENSRLKHF